MSAAQAEGLRLALFNGKIWYRSIANDIVPFKRSEFRAVLASRLAIHVSTPEIARVVNAAIDLLINDAATSIQSYIAPGFALFLLETDADGRAILGYLNQAGGFNGRLAVLYDRLRIATREFCGSLASRFAPTFIGFARRLRLLMPLLKAVGLDVLFKHREDGNHVEFLIDKALFNPQPIDSLPGGYRTAGESFSRKCKFYLNVAHQHLLRLAFRFRLAADSLSSLESTLEATLSTPENYFGAPLRFSPASNSA
jgi:hypothetical protein